MYLSRDKALSKAMFFCAYRERFSAELIERLKKWGVKNEDISYILDYLLKGEYIDDQRFTNAYVSGKFRLKKWGRIKIMMELKGIGVSDIMISKGLNEISLSDYKDCLKKLAEAKLKTTKGKSKYVIQNKVANFLQRKGYESELIWEVLNQLN